MTNAWIGTCQYTWPTVASKVAKWDRWLVGLSGSLGMSHGVYLPLTLYSNLIKNMHNSSYHSDDNKIWPIYLLIFPFLLQVIIINIGNRQQQWLISKTGLQTPKKPLCAKKPKKPFIGRTYLFPDHPWTQQKQFLWLWQLKNVLLQ